MGSGKSAVGKALASLMDLPFVDADEEIERRESTTIREIFENRGESVFRRIESRVLREIVRNQGSFVFATGGGLPCSRGNSRFMRKKGTVVYLEVSPEEIISRIGNGSTRPVFTRITEGRSDLDGVRDLLRERKRWYEKAHFTVKSGGSPLDTAKKIAGLVTGPVTHINGR